MNLKKFLKTLKLNESTISLILGVLVIVVAGVLVFNFFKSRNEGETLETGEVTEAQQEEGPTIVRDGKTYHVVQSDDSLWSIAEKYYKSGYNWVDIAKANNLSNANTISVGQELLIPEVDAKVATVLGEPSATPEPTKIAENTTETPTESLESPTPTAEKLANTSSEDKIEGDSYTVVAGDNLWKICERAYGDGYKWSEVAKANKLENPNIIHPGDVITLAR